MWPVEYSRKFFESLLVSWFDVARQESVAAPQKKRVSRGDAVAQRINASLRFHILLCASAIPHEQPDVLRGADER
ncbi:MAG TPA: hypothetical protein VLA12_01630 [Planctomycetaceae bacterium]|nr:hypothetical protein [Planctomycetaceae bacterium]